mgnify:CR=1 FL=1
MSFTEKEIVIDWAQHRKEGDLQGVIKLKRYLVIYFKEPKNNWNNNYGVFSFKMRIHKLNSSPKAYYLLCDSRVG